MKFALFAVALLAVLVFPAGRAAAGTGGSFDARAEQVVTDLNAGDFSDVAAEFDATMSSQLTADDLALAWKTYQDLLGSFQSAGQPTSVMRGDITVEQVPVQLAQSPGEVRVSFNPDGTIAGLFFLRPGVPVPDAP